MEIGLDLVIWLQRGRPYAEIGFCGIGGKSVAMQEGEWKYKYLERGQETRHPPGSDK